MKKSVTMGLIFASIVLPIEIKAQEVLFISQVSSKSFSTERTAPDSRQPSSDSFNSVLKSNFELLDTDNRKYEREYEWNNQLRDKGVLSDSDEEQLGKKLALINTRDLIDRNIEGTALEDLYTGIKKGIEGFKRVTSLSLVENEKGDFKALAAHDEEKTKKSVTHFKMYLEPTMSDGVKVSAKTMKYLNFDYYPTKQKAMLVLGVDF